MKQELDSLSVVKYEERFHCGSHRGRREGRGAEGQVGGADRARLFRVPLVKATML